METRKSKGSKFLYNVVINDCTSLFPSVSKIRKDLTMKLHAWNVKSKLTLNSMIISMMIPLFHDFGNERILNSIVSITRLSFLPYPLNEKDSTIQNIRMKCKIEINSMIISMILLSYDFGRARDRKSLKRKIRFELETILHNNYKWCELRV